MAKIYKLKDSEMNEFILRKCGFESIEGHENLNIMIKPIIYDIKDELPQSLINGFYNNPQWKEQIWSKNKKLLKEEIGLEYDESGKAIISEQLKEIVCEWRVQIDFDDNWIGFTSGDPFDQKIFYMKEALDRYVKDTIESLSNVIEVIDVEE